MKAIKTILVLFLSASVFGNDGAYLTRGGVIYPTVESKISLKKEVLSFSVQDKICNVDIVFEFDNPESVERKLLVGFQAPSATGDVKETIFNTNQIYDFTIIANGENVQHKLMAAKCADCKLKEPKDIQFTFEQNGVFVYLFEITFRPGKNQINHSYSFPASSSVTFDQIYNYILTTGAKWAGGTINDLTVQIDLGPNSDFYVLDIFGESANWSVIGDGQVTNKKFDYWGKGFAHIVNIQSGKLQIGVKDFTPTKNIEFGIVNNHYPFDYVTETLSAD